MVSKRFDEVEVSRCTVDEWLEEEARRAEEDRDHEERRERRHEEAMRNEQARREADEEDDERRRARDYPADVDPETLSPEEKREWEQYQELKEKFNRGAWYTILVIAGVAVAGGIGSLALATRRALRSDEP